MLSNVIITNMLRYYDMAVDPELLKRYLTQVCAANCMVTGRELDSDWTLTVTRQ